MIGSSQERQKAQQYYEAGLALFHESRYTQALDHLKQAEDAFRAYDSRGHPFSHPLPNGISGLANTLALSGLCHLKRGDHRKALASFEASLVNARFERKRPFKLFLRTLTQNMLVCYEKALERITPETIIHLQDSEAVIDINYRFPYSLSADALVLARLYELDPVQHVRFHDFYVRAQARDRELRRQDIRANERSMIGMSMYAWGTIILIWSVYILYVIKSLLTRS